MIELIREKPDVVRASLKKRGMKPKIVDDIARLDSEWRKLKGMTDELRAKKNRLSQEINKAKKAGKNAKKQIEQATIVAKQISQNEEKLKQYRQELHERLCGLPNVLDESVPEGKNSRDNKVIKEFGSPKKFFFKPKNHVELLETHDLADFGRAAKISGARWYFLKNELALLSVALARYGIDFMRDKGYELVIPPFMINKQSYDGVIAMQNFADMMYKVENENLYPIATAEHPLVSSRQGEAFLDKDLPLKLVGYSACFRKEAGTHGVETKGIFRVHQFDKVEQVAFSTPEKSEEVHEELINNAIEFWKTLEVPFRQVLLCSGDTGLVAAKQYDIEAWFPAAQAYEEVGSCSNVTDWQSSRLNIKCQTQPGQNRRFCHTLNSTLVAVQRALAAIIENNQQKDGTINIPKALQKYAGFKTISKKK